MSFDNTKFAEIVSKTHTEQAIWFLNGFWKDGLEQDAEKVWEYVHMMIEIETGKPKLYGRRSDDVKQGPDLDELQAHVFLEKMNEVLTVRELRDRLTKLDIDNNKRMALSEYLLDKYNYTPQQLVDAPQGDVDPEKLAAAQRAVEEASAALDTAIDADAAAKQRQKELEAAVAELNAQEKAYNDKLAGLEDVAANSPSSLKRLKAKNEIHQLKQEDPLPLRKAKLTQGAALKRANKATIEAAAALARAKDLFAQAEEQLAVIKRSGDGVARGAIWWMERELEEKKKFMPH